MPRKSGRGSGRKVMKPFSELNRTSTPFQTVQKNRRLGRRAYGRRSRHRISVVGYSGRHVRLAELDVRRLLIGGRNLIPHQHPEAQVGDDSMLLAAALVFWAAISTCLYVVMLGWPSTVGRWNRIVNQHPVVLRIGNE